MKNISPKSIFDHFDNLLDLCQADQEIYIDSFEDESQRLLLRQMLDATSSSLTECILDRPLYSNLAKGSK